MGAIFKLAGAAAGLLIVGSCMNGMTSTSESSGLASSRTTATPTPTTTSSSPTITPAAPTRAAQPLQAQPAQARAVTGTQVTVTKVIDGDTLEIAGGQQLRLLGIESCEMNTPGGHDAKAAAEQLLTAGRTVEMAPEPTGDDTDPDGRLLRYVLIDGRDFGVQMVEWDHTGIYQGQHDASGAYVELLYQHDTRRAANPPSGRECGQFAPAPAPAPARSSNDDRAPRVESNSDSDKARTAPAPTSYKNCDAVRAAGKAPLYAGEPGYSRKLDRDGDGIACE